jgi:hypothetical protein
MLFGVLIGTGASFAYVLRAPASYQSASLLMVTSQQADGRSESWLTTNPSRLRAATEILLDQAASPPVYEAVSLVVRPQAEIEPEELEGLVKTGVIDIHQSGKSSFISIAVTDADPERAQLLADGYARGLINYVNDQVKTATDRRRVELARQIELTQMRMRSLPLQSPDPSVSQTVASVYAVLLQSTIRDQLEAEMAASSTVAPLSRYGTVSDPVPVMNTRRIYLAGATSGGAVGLVLAALFELIRVRRRSRPLPLVSTRRSRPGYDRAPTSVTVSAPRNGRAMPTGPRVYGKITPSTGRPASGGAAL